MAKKRKFDPKTMTGDMTQEEFLSYIINEFEEANKSGDKERGDRAMKLIDDATAKMAKLIKGKRKHMVN